MQFPAPQFYCTRLQNTKFRPRNFIVLGHKNRNIYIPRAGCNFQPHNFIVPGHKNKNDFIHRAGHNFWPHNFIVLGHKQFFLPRSAATDKIFGPGISLFWAAKIEIFLSLGQDAISGPTILSCQAAKTNIILSTQDTISGPRILLC